MTLATQPSSPVRHGWRQLVLGGALYLLLGCTAAAGSDAVVLDRLLDQTGRGVTQSLAQLTDVKCTELVNQTKLAKTGKLEYQEDSTFDYLLMVQPAGGEVNLIESREEEKQAKHKKDLPLLVTNGFSTLLLIFHPSYQANFQFTLLENDLLNGRECACIRFRHVHGTRSTAVLLLRSHEYPLDLQGVVWVDKETGRVLRIQAELESPMDDVGLRSLTSEVQYGAVPFPAIKQVYWLPISARVEVETPKQHWRNVHRFTAYQRFSTSVKSSIGNQ
jgi:hypothetical protein